ncbi:MAG TPA: hypothetical protein VKB87_03705 [Myxococcaceae bacterium]|nr:hypothetical protein [Myxococcaceae bacterium]
MRAALLEQLAGRIEGGSLALLVSVGEALVVVPCRAAFEVCRAVFVRESPTVVRSQTIFSDEFTLFL